MTSSFLQRTFNNGNNPDKKFQQLSDTLHCTLVNERQDLEHFAEIADQMRQNTRNAELIRDRIKTLRDNLDECAETIKNASDSSSEFQNQLNKLGIDLQFSQGENAGTPAQDNFQSRRISTLFNGEKSKMIVHELNHQQIKTKLLKILEPAGRNSGESRKSEPVWNQQYLDSCSSLPQSNDSSFCSLDLNEQYSGDEDTELLLYLVKIAEKFQMILGERFNTLSKKMEESVSEEWNRMIKDTVRKSRYEGKEFFTRLSAYHESMRNLNTNLNRSSSGSAGDESPPAQLDIPLERSSSNENAEEAQPSGTSVVSKSIKSLFTPRPQQPKTFDIKRYMQLKDLFEESKELLIAKTESTAVKFEEAEMEWETGIFPQKMLSYLKEMRTFFQSGLDACNELLPVEMAEMFEKAMKKRHISRRLNLEQTAAEIQDLFKREQPLMSPPPAPPTVPIPLPLPPKPENLEKKLPRRAPPPVPADKPKIIAPPKFAPPPPPKPTNMKLTSSIPPTPPISPSSLNQVIETKKFRRSVKVPEGLGSDSSELINKIVDPSVEFLFKTLLKNGKCLPEPSNVNQVLPPSPFDAIKRSIQLTIEAGLLPEWTCVSFENWKDEIFIPRYKEFCGEQKISDSISDTKDEFIENLHLHFMWSHGKHYLQKCVNELHEMFISTALAHNSIEDIDWLEFLRKIWRALLGHRGLITSNMKQVLSHLVQVSGFCNDEDKIELQRFVSMTLFHQMILPAMNNMPKLIEYWKLNPHSCILSSKKVSSQSPLNMDLPALYIELVTKVDYLLRVTLGHSLEIPIPSSGNEMDDIRMEPVGHQMSIELKTSFEDFFSNVTKCTNRATILQETPDYWMIETRCQEWRTLYNP